MIVLPVTSIGCLQCMLLFVLRDTNPVTPFSSGFSMIEEARFRRTTTTIND